MCVEANSLEIIIHLANRSVPVFVSALLFEFSINVSDVCARFYSRKSCPPLKRMRPIRPWQWNGPRKCDSINLQHFRIGGMMFCLSFKATIFATSKCVGKSFHRNVASVPILPSRVDPTSEPDSLKDDCRHLRWKNWMENTDTLVGIVWSCWIQRIFIIFT